MLHLIAFLSLPARSAQLCRYAHQWPVQSDLPSRLTSIPAACLLSGGRLHLPICRTRLRPHELAGSTAHGPAEQPLGDGGGGMRRLETTPAGKTVAATGLMVRPW